MSNATASFIYNCLIRVPVTQCDGVLFRWVEMTTYHKHLHSFLFALSSVA